MTHLYTRASEYGLRALRAMMQDPDRSWRIVEICEEAEIPEQFTRKVFQVLVRAGLLNSTRGPGGGFRFAVNPGDIPLAEVIDAVESGPRFDQCILGFSECSDRDPCPLHYLWAPIKTSALKMLNESTVVDLAWKSPARKKRAKKKAPKRKSASRRR